MNKPKVSIIIVNFNGGKVFRECLESLKKIKYPNYEIIVIDNGSSDGTEKLAIIRNKENLGFVGANNQGIKIAKGIYILLLNNDTKVEANFLNILIAKMEKEKKIGVLQPKIYLMDKPGYLDNAGSFLNTFGFSNHWGFMEKDSEEFNEEREIFSAKGACLLTRKKIIDKIGLFDEDYFAYFEESDFCWRVWMAGWKVLYFPDTFIYHKLGFTSKKLPTLEINYHSLKNRIESFIKNLETFNIFVFVGIHIIFLTILTCVYLIEFKLDRAGIVIKSVYWNFVNLPSTLRKRKIVQEIRTRTDSQILPIIMQKTDIFGFISHFFATEKNFYVKK